NAPAAPAGRARLVRRWPRGMVATDTSAYPEVSKLAESFGNDQLQNCKVRLSRVIRPGHPVGEHSFRLTWHAEQRRRPSASARRYWREQLEQIRPTNPAIPVHHVFLEGEPAAEIGRYAADANMDLIVMGTHGRTGLERLLLGSVAEQTLRSAPCSVLVVKLPRGVPAAEKPHVGVAVPAR